MTFTSTLLRSVGALALGAIGAAAAAQTRLPGLWENSISMQSPVGEINLSDIQRQFAALPPEQRQRIEQMMASRGVKLSPGGNAVRVCVTKEQAERPPEVKLDASCTQQDVQRSGNTVHFKFECSRPRPMRGEGEVTFTDEKTYAGQSTVEADLNGTVQKTTMTMAGRWIADDCGDAKARAAPGQ